MLEIERFDNDVLYIYGRLDGGTYINIKPILSDFNKFVEHIRKGLFASLHTGNKDFSLYSVKDVNFGSKLFIETCGNVFAISQDDSKSIVEQFNKFYDDINEEEVL